MKLVRRLARAALTLLALMIAAWVCLEASPGSPAERAARASGRLGDETAVLPGDLRARIVAEEGRAFGLDRPAPERLARYVGGVVTGDLGRGWRDGRPVGASIARALPTTVGLILGGLLVAYVVGGAGALVAASAPGRRRDAVVRAMCAVALAVPMAWAVVAAVRRFGPGDPLTAVMPVACLSYVAAAVIARHGRATLVAALDEPFCEAARARGASSSRVLFVHALGWSGPTFAALGAALVPHLLGAALVVERAFDLPGLGALLLDGARAGDAPVVLGVTLVAGVIVAVASMLGELVASWADPRMRGDA